MLIGSRLNIKGIDVKCDQLVGPFCLPLPSDEVQLENFPRMLDCPWKSPEDFSIALREINEIYEGILPIFSDGLNQIHNLQKPVRFWRILIGPWLYWIINVIYDKYHRLLKAVQKNSGNLIVSDEKLFYIPQDTFEFVVSVNHNDCYNFQILHLVAQFVDYPMSFFSMCEPKKITKKNIFNEDSKKLSVKISGYKLLSKLFYRYSNIHLYHSGHASKFILGLFLKSKAKIVEVDTERSEISYPNADMDLRKKFSQNLLSRLSSNKELLYYELICTIAAQQIPVCFFEGFEELKIAAKKQFGSKIPKKIISSIAWYSDERFKIWSANCALKGTTLVGLQHGGNYGISQYLFPENHEIEITDKYLTWGWGNENHKIHPSPAQKLLDITPLNTHKNVSDEVLYIGTSGRRFSLQFPDISEIFFKYFENQVNFIEVLPERLRKKLRIRLHREDGIWEIQKRLSKKFENLKFETWDIPFRKSILNAKIIIIDHLSTTYIEALASNIPTILFWDANTTLIRESTKPYFDNFEKVGIFQKSGENAAKFLESIEKNIQEWWDSPDVQRVVKSFLSVFGRKHDQPLKEWRDLLESI